MAVGVCAWWVQGGQKALVFESCQHEFSRHAGQRDCWGSMKVQTDPAHRRGYMVSGSGRERWIV